MRVRGRQLLIVPALAALVLSAAAAGQANAGAPTEARQQRAQSVDAVEPGQGLAACDGGAQKGIRARMNDLPTTLGENPGFMPLPGASVAFAGPANGTDQILVTFSAEAVLRGQPVTYATPVDRIELQVLLDGAPMQPLNDLTFTTGAGESNTTQACDRVGAGNHVVTVMWRLVDEPAFGVLTGTIDDWLLNVQFNN